MQIETCQVGGGIQLGDRTRIVIHSRQGERIGIGAKAPVGTSLFLGGALVSPIAGTIGVWSYLFSLQALRRFTLGRFEVRIWLPGELIPSAADCEDWLHIGVAPSGAPAGFDPLDTALPVPVASAFPLVRIERDGRRPFSSGP